MAHLTEITITGRVQGVGFRAFVEQEARKRDLRGSVKNEANGTVHAEFIGPIDSVTEMVDLCRQGPSLASVKNVLLIREADDVKRDEYQPFHINY